MYGTSRLKGSEGVPEPRLWRLRNLHHSQTRNRFWPLRTLWYWPAQAEVLAPCRGWAWSEPEELTEGQFDPGECHPHPSVNSDRGRWGFRHCVWVYMCKHGEQRAMQGMKILPGASPCPTPAHWTPACSSPRWPWEAMVGEWREWDRRKDTPSKVHYQVDG